MKVTLRRFACVLLMLCLFFSPSALAEKRTLTTNDGDVPKDFKTAHPDVQIAIAPSNSHTTEMDMLLHAEGLDAADVDSSNVDMTYLKENGVLFDLSVSEVIRKAVSRMNPNVQKLVTDDEGRILALPYRFNDHSVYWLQDAWDAAGLTETDVPHSYLELLDFLEMWLERTDEHPEKNICVSRLTGYTMTGVKQYDFTNWLMDMLRMCWEYQQRYAGLPVNYDDPQFIALAERTRGIGKALYKSEPRYKKRQKMLELFRSDLSGGPYANGGREYGVSHTIPLRLTSDQPALLDFGGSMWVVRADAPNPEDALALLEAVCPNKPYSFFQYNLYTDFPAGSYKESGWKETFVLSQGWLDDWRSFDGTLVSYPYEYTWENKSMHKFFDDKLSAEELAQKLNTLIALPWWEQVKQDVECK